MKETTTKHLATLLERHPELAGAADGIQRAAQMICDSYLAGGKVMICGNGGSAADSEHIVGEFMKGFILPRALTDSENDCLRTAGIPEMSAKLQRGVPAIALTGHISLSTAVLNDNDPYMAFAQQAFVLGRPKDVLIGISTSGNAGNVLAAVQVAKAFGVSTIGLTGARPSKLEEACDVTIKVPETETYRVQELHLPAYHTICLMVEEELFG